MFLVFSLFVMGCSDDGDDGTGPSKNSIVGKWKLMKSFSTYENGDEWVEFLNGYGYDEDGFITSDQYQILYIFYEDGTGMSNARHFNPEYMEDWEELAPYNFEFIWEISNVSGNKIKITTYNEEFNEWEEPDIYNYQLNGDLLRLSYGAIEDHTGLYVVFTDEYQRQ
jgi:hypothetical protein